MFSLIGSVLGFGTSFLPKILGYFQQKQDNAHELKMIIAQTEAQTKLEHVRLEGVNIEADISETEALHKEQTKITIKASQWVINLNATVRPVMTYLLFIEFMVLTILLATGAIGAGDYSMIWDEPMQALWAAVVSFWYGSRTFNRGGHS
jgi:hypothetical protein